MHTLIVKSLELPLLIAFLLCAAILSRSQTEAEFHKDCGALSKPGQYPDYASTPPYSIEHRNYDASKPPVLVLQISIPAKGFDGTAIVRLACKLRVDFSKETAVHALIFDDKKAARNLRLGFTDQDGYGLYLWHLKARYELNRTTKQQFVEVLVPRIRDELLSSERIRYWLTPVD